MDEERIKRLEFECRNLKRYVDDLEKQGWDILNFLNVLVDSIKTDKKIKKVLKGVVRNL